MTMERNSAHPSTRPFRLVRYFTLTSLAMFAVVAIALTYFLSQQGSLVTRMQAQQGEFFQQVQQRFARQQDEVARRDLLAIHEAGNVNLTRLFANTLWERDFVPFVAKAAQIGVEHCRAIADAIDPQDGKAKPTVEKKACFADVGRRIMAIPGFEALHAKTFEAMRKSTVFKVKVFDLRGITVYSSELAQIGEDKAFNAGWKSALAGKPASELVYRDKFSAFEGVVEKRDLIGSYLPVVAPGGDRVVGVFEVYSDVTPFLDQIKATSAHIAATAAENQRNVAQMSAESEERISEMGGMAVLIAAGLLLALFAALFLIVRRAARIIAEQERERERAQQHLVQAEKMASLGQMVAGVAHQLNTPIAFSQNNVSMVLDAIRSYQLPLSVAGRFADLLKDHDGDVLALNVAQARERVTSIDPADLDVALPAEMLSDTLQGLDQMRELVQNLRDFTRLDRARTTRTDLVKGLRNVAYIARSVIPPHIQLVEDYEPVPEIEGNVTQLNQVFMNLVNNAAQAITAERGTITLRTRAEGAVIRVEVSDTGTGIPPEVLPQIWDMHFTTKEVGEGTGLGLPIARSIVQEHGGEITVATEVGRGTTFTVRLPAYVAAAAEAVAA